MSRQYKRPASTLIDAYIWHLFRSLTSGVDLDQEELVAMWDLRGSDNSIHVAGKKGVSAESVGESPVGLFNEGLREEHWMCIVVRTLNGMASSFATSLVRGHEVSLHDCSCAQNGTVLHISGKNRYIYVILIL